MFYIKQKLTCFSVYTCAAVRKECIPQVLLPEEEKIIVEEIKSNGQTVTEEKYVVAFINESLSYFSIFLQ